MKSIIPFRILSDAKVSFLIFENNSFFGSDDEKQMFRPFFDLNNIGLWNVVGLVFLE
jgi:hypothetical protein